MNSSLDDMVVGDGSTGKKCILLSILKGSSINWKRKKGSEAMPVIGQIRTHTTLPGGSTSLILFDSLVDFAIGSNHYTYMYLFFQH